MIKDNQRIFNQLHVVIDGIVIILAYLLAWWIQFRIITAKALGLPFQTYFAALLLCLDICSFIINFIYIVQRELQGVNRNF